MTSVLEKLERAVIAGFVLAAIIFWLLVRPAAFDYGYWTFFMRWLHVLSGVMWIGLLWYFNFVQIPSMPKIPDEQKPAVSKVIAPTALFWFRYAALATVATGLLLAYMNGYIGQALMLGGAEGVPQHRAIGIGMWLGLIMAFNVWFLIWPNQQKALGLVDATPDEKKAAGRMAMLVSRANTVLSVPMLYAMVSAQNI
ncbi:MAG: hypothetical protein EXQ95_03755 [Alphaproteobacteria bacterium]|nr:hypothetical protein [Alphaproteobacteria bacterium]